MGGKLADAVQMYSLGLRQPNLSLVDCVNFARDVVDAADRRRGRALVASRATAVAARSPSARWRTAPRGWPGRSLRAGCGRGDVVMTVIGNRPEWVYAMVACFRIGAVALPCTEQLRAGRPARAHGRGRAAAGGGRRARPRDGRARPASTARCCACRTSACTTRRPRPAADLGPRRPGADRVHLRHRRRAQADPPRPALPRRASACRPSTGSARARATSAGARRPAAGRSPPATSFIAPWLTGAAALLARRPLRPRGAARDGRARGRERALHGADRVPGDRQAGRAAAAAPAAPRGRRRRAAQPGGRASTGARPPASRSTTATGRPRPARSPGMPIGAAGAARARWASRCPGFRLWVDDGELCADPATVPTFFLDGPRGHLAHRRPRARGRGRLPLVRGPHRRRDHLGRLPDRPVRGGVGARLAPGGGGGRRGGGARTRSAGQVVRAVVVLRDGHEPGDALAARAPGPREGARPRPTSTRASWSSPTRCPKTASGKIRRAS